MLAPSPSQPLKINAAIWGALAHTLWGFFPVYWKLLADRAPLETLSHRVIWSFVFYGAVWVWIFRQDVFSAFNRAKKEMLYIFLASILLTANWGIYIYAVITHRVLEGSLAYFITPLFNVAVGVGIFKEKFPLAMRLAVGFAVVGVLAKIFLSPTFPWIALTLALSFGVYGVIKKKLTVPVSTSSVFESAAMLIPAVVYLFSSKHLVPMSIDFRTWCLFVGGGVITGLPLLLFAYAAQRVPISIMGMLQFIAPTLQALIAVFIFHEDFSFAQWCSFGLIWIGAGFYLIHQGLRFPQSN